MLVGPCWSPSAVRVWRWGGELRTNYKCKWIPTMSNFLVALAGNPNAGKSTIFNALTGANQHVGNWPGKTVAQKAGSLQLGAQTITLVDLPGTYSLSAYSPEEVIARDFLLGQRPALVVNVLDAANLERNLYLTVQLLEMNMPLLVVLNMLDAAASRGITIDLPKLSRALQSPVITAIASQGAGIEQLKRHLTALQPQKARQAHD